MKIGIETKGFDGWGGGIDFVYHVASSIEIADKAHQIEKHLLLSKNDLHFHLMKLLHPYNAMINAIKEGKPLRWQSWKGFDEHYLRQIFSNLQSYTINLPGFTYNSHLKFAQEKQFDVLLPCIKPPSRKYNGLWIGYLPDFQHKHLPEYFTNKEIKQRDSSFALMLKQANHVIVNSNEAKSDAERYINNINANIHVLPFAPSPSLEYLEEDRELQKQYDIGKPYFMISNQFWIHKNYTTAFKAFSELIQIVGNNYQLVCTGNTQDYRFLGHFDELTHLIKSLGINDDVKILGHIPKLDQIALMKKAIAIIQPTLFEGGPGGGSSYDAISLGKQLIISDIKVNREIPPSKRVIYFQPRDPNSLANTMKEVLLIKNNNLSKHTLLKKGLANKQKCGAKILDIIKYL